MFELISSEGHNGESWSLEQKVQDMVDTLEKKLYSEGRPGESSSQVAKFVKTEKKWGEIVETQL